jgi:hypothetical protein
MNITSTDILSMLLFENYEVIIFTTQKIISKEEDMFYKNININFEETSQSIKQSYRFYKKRLIRTKIVSVDIGPCRSSAVRRWLPTAAARVGVQAACGVCGGQSGTGAGFLRVLRFPLPIIPPISPLS